MSNLHASQPLTLPCGLTLPNRLAKAALAESMSRQQALPGHQFLSSYGAWAKGGWGLVMTGNVQVDHRYLGTPQDVAYNPDVEYDDMLRAWTSWAEACRRHDTPTIVQLNHPGRQTPLGAGSRGYLEKSVAPSAIPLDFGSSLIQRLASALVFGTPKEMTKEDIDHVIQRFADSALLASRAGFNGVEIHAAHGYLLAQFLSPRSNKRTDEYGATAKGRARLLVEVIRAIREATPEKGFCVGLKLNSVDHQSAEDFAGFLEQVGMISEAGVDFLEISGGTYETPTMMTTTDDQAAAAAAGPVSESTKKREAFFIEFANAIREHVPNVPLMVTGGFRTRAGMEEALASNSCDLIGLGRASVMNPSLPQDVILNEKLSDEEAVIKIHHAPASAFVKLTGIKSVGAGAEVAWYAMKIRRQGRL